MSTISRAVTGALALVVLLKGGAARAADPWELFQPTDSNCSNTNGELVHGAVQVHDLEGTGQFDADWARVQQRAFRSYEARILNSNLRLAETIKEWFSGHDAGGGGGTAVETAPPVEAKPKAARARTKKKVETTEDAGPRDDAASDATAAVAEAPAAQPVAEPARPAPVVVEAPVRPAPIVEAPVVHDTPEVVTTPEVETPEMPRVAASAPAPAPAAPAAPGTHKPTAPGGVVHDLNRPPQLRAGSPAS